MQATEKCPRDRDHASELYFALRDMRFHLSYLVGHFDFDNDEDHYGFPRLLEAIQELRAAIDESEIDLAQRFEHCRYLIDICAHRDLVKSARISGEARHLAARIKRAVELNT